MFSIKTLDLGGIISSKYNFELHLKVLEALGAHNLEGFHWNVGWIMGPNSQTDYVFPSSVNLANLKSFTLLITGLKSGGGWNTYKFLETWVHPVRNVSSLKLQCISRYSKVFLKALAPVSGSFSNLNEILITAVDLCILRLLLCLELVQPLKKLELVGIRVNKKQARFCKI